MTAWTFNDISDQRGRRPNPRSAMKPADGALPTLRAAVDEAAREGSYWGLGCFQEITRPPAPARISSCAKDVASAERRWRVSEKRTALAVSLSSLSKAVA